ncbi:uncharacterized protein ARMOST_19666 [Armillaria ostoyae]|uniref:Uncharacterized protein n=1 Tax=Armillaria ostoyae TaxID=47428 RepID=A0A284S576_ARMOS|nr:uncharacterized protein ARMOST_19666 [Armillaria ostoyae]
MTPDLTTQQLIGIVSTIVGTCLTSLLTTLIVLTWREQIVEYLYRHGILLRPRRRRQPPAPFPLHYIVPYAHSRSTMDRPILEEQRLQSRAPYPPNSSDEFPPRAQAEPPRNATPGPSNTRHTPSPPSSPAPEEANDRDLRAHYDRFPPPEYDPNDLPPPERALIPLRPRPLLAALRAPPERIFIRAPTGQFPDGSSSESDGGFYGAVARRRDPERVITITTDDENNLNALELPLPDDDGDDSVLHLPPPRRPDDPLNPDGLNYEWPALEDVDRQILGPERTLAWEIRRDDVETRYNLAAHNCVPMDYYLATTYGDELPRLGREAVITARIFENRYKPSQYATHTFSGQGPDDEEEGGPSKPSDKTLAEEQRQAAEAAGKLLNRIAELEKELNDEEMRHRDHAAKWGLPFHLSNRGKDPDRRRQPAHLPLPPNQYRPLWRRDDRYSVPRPPPDQGRPDPLPQPVGTADAAAPFMNVRPMMVTIPKAFTGDHEDIERFIGDCLIYFEAHASYFILPSHMIPFATSLFDGATKTWWVHE